MNSRDVEALRDAVDEAGRLHKSERVVGNRVRQKSREQQQRCGHVHMTKVKEEIRLVIDLEDGLCALFGDEQLDALETQRVHAVALLRVVLCAREANEEHE